MRHFKDTEILAAAREAQAERIRKTLLCNFIGGGSRIDKWDDFRYSLCSFSTSDVARQGNTPDVNQLRARLRKLVASGDLIDRSYTSRHIAFHFSRAVCDAMAAEGIAALLAKGYSETEIRKLP